MEEIINKFNELVQEMALAVSEAKDEKEAQEIQSKYDTLIDEAEKALEEDLEAFIQKEQKALEEEQKLAEIPLEEEEDDGEKDITALKQELKDKYTVKELKAILKEGGIKGYSRLNESQLIDIIIENNLA